MGVLVDIEEELIRLAGMIHPLSVCADTTTISPLPKLAVFMGVRGTAYSLIEWVIFNTDPKELPSGVNKLRRDAL